MAESGDPKEKKTGKKTTRKILKTGKRWVETDIAHQRRKRDVKMPLHEGGLRMPADGLNRTPGSPRS